MNNILNILNRKKLQFFYLFYILLILPLLSPIAENVDLLDTIKILTINCILFGSIALVSLFWSPRFEKSIYSILLVITILPAAILLSYLLFAHVLLEQNSITSLFETNTNESKEFISDYLNPWIVIGMGAYILVPIVMIWKMKAQEVLKIKHNKLLFTISLSCIIAITTIPSLSSSVYFLNFYHTFISYKVRLANEEREISARQTAPYKVINLEKDSVPQTIVVVIGESLTRHHLQLYGYGRKTNPLLAEIKNNLYIYDDAVSPQVHTIPVIRSILTFLEYDNPNYFVEKPSIFELFNRAGYETYFISNQGFGGKNKSSYDVILELAKHKYDLTSEKQHDEVVIGTLKNILNSDQHKNKLIVIHLIGNHMAYKFRYPKDYELFNNKSDHYIQNTPFRDSQAIKMMDEYDNSVAYNDFVISEVINNLEKSSCKSAMVYLSDHGEEMYDTRAFAGHAYEKLSRPMCEVPFIVWLSSSFQQSRNDLLFDTRRSFSTSDLLFSVSDLANIDYKDFDASRSVFSNQFKKRDRFVGEQNYDNLKK